MVVWPRFRLIRRRGTRNYRQVLFAHSEATQVQAISGATGQVTPQGQLRRTHLRTNGSDTKMDVVSGIQKTMLQYVAIMQLYSQVQACLLESLGQLCHAWMYTYGGFQKWWYPQMVTL